MEDGRGRPSHQTACGLDFDGAQPSFNRFDRMRSSEMDGS
jgi:hypothetical protein